MSERARTGGAAKTRTQEYDLHLYVAGSTPKSITAFHNLKELCEEHLAGRYRIQIIDLEKHPQLARANQILAVPTLVRVEPAPVCKIVGTLKDTERVLTRLDLRAADADPFAARKGGRHAG